MSWNNPAVIALTSKLGHRNIDQLCHAFLCNGSLGTLLLQFELMAKAGLHEDALYGAAVVVGFSQMAHGYADAALSVTEQTLLQAFNPSREVKWELPDGMASDIRGVLEKAKADFSPEDVIALPLVSQNEEQERLSAAAQAIFARASSTSYEAQTRVKASHLKNRYFGLRSTEAVNA